MDLKLELAVIVDIGEPFVKATYVLEGDGPLVFACYEKVSAISRFCQAPHFPNVREMATTIVEDDQSLNVATLERGAKICVEPAITCVIRELNVDLYDVLVAFKGARLCCPVSI